MTVKLVKCIACNGNGKVKRIIQHAKSFTWEKAAAAYLELYENV